MQNKTHTPAGTLEHIATIQRMERGKLCAMSQGKNGPYYNLQCRENGKPVSRYVPQDQVELVQENTQNYRTFKELVDDYAEQIIVRTRQERMSGQKKRVLRSPSSKVKRSAI